MKIGILGTGMVGETLGSKFVELGNQVKMGSRKAGNEKAVGWARTNGANASEGSFADAASFGEIVFNCTSGAASLEALKSAGAKNLNGKILVDVANPLDFSKGMPPTLTVSNTDSLGEQIQRAFPEAKVIKTLNTVNAKVMVNRSIVHGEHDLFIGGNDADAKATIMDLLKRSFGWKSIIDLGDITAARGMEMWLPLWLRLWGVLQRPNFNLHIIR